MIQACLSIKIADSCEITGRCQEHAACNGCPAARCWDFLWTYPDPKANRVHFTVGNRHAVIKNLLEGRRNLDSSCRKSFNRKFQSYKLERYRASKSEVFASQWNQMDRMIG